MGQVDIVVYQCDLPGCGAQKVSAKDHWTEIGLDPWPIGGAIAERRKDIVNDGKEWTSRIYTTEAAAALEAGYAYSKSKVRRFVFCPEHVDANDNWQELFQKVTNAT